MRSHPSYPTYPTRPALLLAAALAVAAAGTMTALGGCASTGRGPASGPFAELVIQNDNSRIVTVYAVRSGTRMRLGTVSGVSTVTFDLRRDMLESDGRLRVLVEPLGSTSRYFSDPIFVAEGEIVELVVSSLVR